VHRIASLASLHYCCSSARRPGPPSLQSNHASKPHLPLDSILPRCFLKISRSDLRCSGAGSSSRDKDGGEADAPARHWYRREPRPQQGLGPTAGEEPPSDPTAVAASALASCPGEQGGRGVLPLPQPPPGAPPLHRGAARLPGGRSLPARSVHRTVYSIFLNKGAAFNSTVTALAM
jgi:hypothetical protein